MTNNATELKDFEGRWDKLMLVERVRTLEHFDSIFRKYVKETKDDEMRKLYKEAIEWCSKKRLEIVKELI